MLARFNHVNVIFMVNTSQYVLQNTQTFCGVPASFAVVLQIIILIIIIMVFVYLIADIPRNLTLPTSATQGSAIYRKVKR